MSAIFSAFYRPHVGCLLMIVAVLPGCGKSPLEARDRPSQEPSPANATDDSTPSGKPAAVTGGNVPHNFQDQAAQAGLDFKMNFLPHEQGETFKINLYDHGCGIAVADFDNDGFDDIYFVNQLGKNALYKNRGNGTFANVTDKAGVGVGDRICVGCMFADYDNDGDQDLFVTSTRGGNLLFENLGTGAFRDVTTQAGVDHVGHSATASFVDFDNDGFLDLLVTNTAQWTTDQFNDKSKSYDGLADLGQLIAARKEDNIAYRNNRDGTFTDITTESGLAGEGWGGDIAAFDYNDDGRIDLLITNMFGASQLYRNEGECKFTAVTKQVLGKISWGAIGAKAFDYDNDGKLDLFVSDMHSDMWLSWTVKGARPHIAERERTKYNFVTGATYIIEPAAFAKKEELIGDLAQIKYEDVLFGNTLFKNDGNGRMTERSDVAGIETWWPWGIATGDFDCDGHEDVFMPSGMGYPFFYWPNQLMMNQGDGTFANRALALGIEPPKAGEFQQEKIAGQDAARSSRCAAVGDFDGDGRLEIVTNNFNDHPYYFRGNLPQKNYIAFKLTGKQCNRDAIGAVVRLHFGDEIMTRQVHSAGGYLSQSSKTLHFGLGNRGKIDRAEIHWPGGGVDRLDAPKLNQVHNVTQSNADPTKAGA